LKYFCGYERYYSSTYNITMTSNTNKSLNTPIYFKLTKFVASIDIILSLTDTIVTALIFFGDEEDFFKSLYYKVVKQKGIILLHSGDEDLTHNSCLSQNIE
ncbi:unnamed protein product, partial [Allacma fusca]